MYICDTYLIVSLKITNVSQILWFELLLEVASTYSDPCIDGYIKYNVCIASHSEANFLPSTSTKH